MNSRKESFLPNLGLLSAQTLVVLLSLCAFFPFMQSFAALAAEIRLVEETRQREASEGGDPLCSVSASELLKRKF